MRNFSARETEWLQELDGIELASFWRRALAISLDGMLMLITIMLVALVGGLGYFAYRKFSGHPLPPLNIMMRHYQVDFDTKDGSPIGHFEGEAVKLINDVVVPILYFGLLTWWGKGRSPGKWACRIRVVSIVHRHLSLWHCVERALGYGAAALEGGFGFVQFFIHPYRRCAQDRLAETIVVTERGYRAMQHKRMHPLLPDEGTNAEEHVADEVLPDEPLQETS